MQYIFQLYGNGRTNFDSELDDSLGELSDRVRHERNAFRRLGLIPALREFSDLVGLIRGTGRIMLVQGAGFSSSILSGFCYDLDLPEQFGLSFERWIDPEILEEPIVVIAKVQMELTSFEQLLAQNDYCVERDDGLIVNCIRKRVFRPNLQSSVVGKEPPNIRLLLSVDRPEHPNGKALPRFLPPDAILKSTKVQAILSEHRFDALLQSCPASVKILSACTPVTKDAYVAAMALAFRNQFEQCSPNAIPFFQEDLMDDLRKTIKISARNSYKLVREFTKCRGESTDEIHACMSKIGLAELAPEQIRSLRRITALSPRSQCKAHICSLVWQSLCRVYSDTLRHEERHAEPTAK